MSGPSKRAPPLPVDDWLATRVDKSERRHRRVGGVGMTVVVAAVTALFASLAADGSLAAGTVIGVLASALWFMTWASHASPRMNKPMWERREVRWDDNSLFVASVGETGPEDVASSWTGEGGRLFIRRKDGVEVGIGDLDAAQRDAIEHTLRCGVRHNKAALTSFEMGHDRGKGCLQPLALIGVLSTLVFAPLVILYAQRGDWPKISAALGVTVLAAMVSWRYRRRDVIAGSDGVWVPRLIGRRFVRHDDIDRADAHGLELTDGRRIRLLAPVEGLGDRVRALQRVRLGDASAAGLHLLERGSRTLSEWKAVLTGLVGEGQYRGQAWTSDTLLSVATDPSATPEHRVAAAVAASANGNAVAKERLRIVAATTADHDLEAALVAAAEEEILVEELERASERHADRS